MNINDIASKTLGDSTSYAIFTYAVDKTLLNPMPRELVRNELNIINNSGYDVWHCWESTFLDMNGIPVTGCLKIIIPSNSEYMLESKSLKLYLNTYDMVKFENVDKYIESVKKDLSESVRSNIEIEFYDYHNIFHINHVTNLFDNIIEHPKLLVDNYNGEYNIHKKPIELQDKKVYNLYIPSLRSRCRHTKQKDTGAVYIEIETDNVIDVSEIYRYVYSLREVSEFHEFCAEKIYTEIKNNYECNVNVFCFYARRGGIDINPCRYDNINNSVMKEYFDIGKLIKGYIGQ